MIKSRSTPEPRCYTTLWCIVNHNKLTCWFFWR